MASASKTATTTNGSGGSFTLKISFSETKTDQETNKSALSLTASLTKGSGDFSVTNAGTLEIWWHDNKDYSTTTKLKSVTLSKPGSTSATLNVTHKADGTLSGYAVAKWVKSSSSTYPPSSATATTSTTALTTIKRLTTLDSFTVDNGNLTGNYEVKYTPKNANFTNILVIEMFESGSTGASHTIETFDLGQGTTQLTKTFTLSNDAISTIVNNKYTGSLVASINTYSNDVLIGYSESKTLSVNLTSLQTFTPRLVVPSTDTKTLGLVNNNTTFINGISKVTGSIINTTYNFKKYIFNDGRTTYEETNVTKNFPYVVDKNYLTYTFSAIDQQGLPTQSKTIKLDEAYTLIDYYVPTISDLVVERSGTETNVNMSFNAKLCNTNFGRVVNNNVTILVEYKRGSDSNFTSYSEVISNISGNNFSYNHTFTGISAETDLQVKVKIIDQCSESMVYLGACPKAISIFDIGDEYFNINGVLAIKDNEVPYFVTNSSNVTTLYDSDGNALTLATSSEIDAYTKSEADNKFDTIESVNQKIANVKQFEAVVVTTLPTTGDSGKIYLKSKQGSSNDIYDEYLWVNSKWEFIGTTAVDLSNYYTKSSVDTLLNAKANKTDIKGEFVYYVVGTNSVGANTTSGSYYATQWKGSNDKITSLYDGLTVAFRIDVAGNGTYGTTLNINGLGEHPVVYNVSSMVGTRYGVKSTIVAVYNSTQTASAYKNNVSTSYTGVWQICDYDTTNVYQLRHNSGTYLASKNIYRYCLLLQTNETTLMPTHTHTTYSTGTSKPINTEEFNPFGEILYYSSTTAVTKDSSITANTLYTHIAIDLRYSFNTGTTLTTNKDVYMVATPTNNGKATLTSPYITQTLPTTDDGKIYIYLGHSYSTSQVEIEQNHPIYYYKNGKLSLFTNRKEPTFSSTTWVDNNLDWSDI